jgi:hypothetical protein
MMAVKRGDYGLQLDIAPRSEDFCPAGGNVHKDDIDFSRAGDMVLLKKQEYGGKVNHRPNIPGFVAGERFRLSHSGIG